MIKYVFLKYHSDCNVCIMHIHIFTWVSVLKSTKLVISGDRISYFFHMPTRVVIIVTGNQNSEFSTIY